jgi:EAL domain-containing protein (putative c-di-GMP-specific phosphodiesterase class I)
VFYLKGYNDKDELFAFYDTIIATLDPLLASERISIGIGILEIDEEVDKNADQLLKNLLITSERAIAQTETGFGLCFYDEEVKAAIEREQDIKQTLEKIINGGENGSFYLNYQPIFDLKADKICGFEALARLNIERHGRIPPLEFIPIAEKTKLIVPLGKIIFRQALRFIKRLEGMGLDEINVSVNISVMQLLHESFVQDISAMIKDARVKAQSVALEITESVFSDNTEEINLILKALKNEGIALAIDDFGTGYSSLSREWELHVDCLKIDKFFVDKLMELPPEKVITGDIISMAHKLGHCVVAEGVEFEEQKEYLKKHGCDKIQGYLISKPLDEDDAVKLTAANGSPNRY